MISIRYTRGKKNRIQKSQTSYWFKAKLFIIIFSITKVQRVWNRYIYFLKVSIIYGAYNNVRSKSSIVTKLDVFWIWPLPLDLLYTVLDFYNLTLTLNFLAWVKIFFGENLSVKILTSTKLGKSKKREHFSEFSQLLKNSSEFRHTTF